MEDISSWKEKFEICIYAKKLIDKLEYLNTKVKNPVDIEEVKKGIYYARKYHGLQMRQSGDPYYSHPIEVAIMLAEFVTYKEVEFYTNNLIIASLLHDTIEDTELTEEIIASIFNPRIGKMVSMLSKGEEQTINILLTLALYLGIDSAKELIEEVCYAIIDPYYKKNKTINNNNHLLFLASQNNS
ncbi:MAG: HD domain-containing protein [Rickettsia endosymbiont of Eriopis connexa]|nr:HD domain-containing protein [Rickettsia endosymbiont of Eriopis connexa]